ncbi:UNVERIFIED_CONTAM: hypothetical protein NCL1_10342 [Trichonephila clavipes]
MSILAGKEEEELLPYPYKTNCLNYTEMWLSANKTGPRTQEMCRHKCLRDISEDCFNCTFPLTLYPRRKEFCYDDDYGTPNCSGGDNPGVLFELCIEKCREDCQRTKFSYQVRESYLTQKVCI